MSTDTISDRPSRTGLTRRGFGRGAAVSGLVAVAGLVTFSEVETGRIGRAYPPTGRFVAFDGGGRLHYTERTPAGPPRGTVVLLHGASGNQADVMLPLGDGLAAQGFHVVAPDRPGHGWSDRPDGEADASPARQAALIRDGLGKLGITRALVFGHSLAGAVAVNFALDQADFTAGLILASPVTHPWPGGDIAWYYHAAASPLAGPLFNRTVTMPMGLAVLDAGIRGVFAPQAPPPDYAERTGVALVLRPADFAANAQDVAHLYDFVSVQAPRMGAITAPTAIVTGDHDGVVLYRVHSFASARVIPGATLRVLPGVGHSPHWAEPDVVLAQILDVAARAGI